VATFKSDKLSRIRSIKRFQLPWLFSIFFTASNAHEILIQMLAKSFCWEWLSNMLPCLSTHSACHLRILNEFSHRQREIFRGRVTKKSCFCILNSLHRAPTIACNYRLMGCHCLQWDDAKVLILHLLNN